MRRSFSVRRLVGGRATPLARRPSLIERTATPGKRCDPPAVDLEGQRIYITEAEADALTVAGATDGRRHLRATDSDSVI